MPRFVTVTPHLPVEELAQRYRHAHDPVERTHWHLLWLVAAGHRVPEVASLVGYTANWVREIIRRYNATGPARITDQRQHSVGHPPLLTPALRAALATALDGPAPDGGLWTCAKVAAWMRDRLGRPVRSQRGWEAMRSLGFTPQRPRPRATNADPAAQAAFKKGGSRRTSTR
ncbi:MAG: winged helix-turn-helix domain-containing protein [Thermomicrobiales bacterium]|jgi:transposase